MSATMDRSRPLSSFSATESTQSAAGTFTTTEEQTAEWNVTSTTTLSRGGSGNGVAESYTGEIVTDSSYTETTITEDDGTISVSGAVWTISGETVYDIIGSYGDDEEDSSRTSLTITSVDEYFSTVEGNEQFEMDGYEASTVFTYESEGSTQRVFSDEKSFSPIANTASWHTSYDHDSSWTLHAELTEFGYTLVVDDSDSESISESSGANSYEPGEGENPSGDYRPRDGGGGGGGEGEGDDSSTEDGEVAIGDPRFRWFVIIRLPSGEIVTVPLELLEHAAKYNPKALIGIEFGNVFGVTPEELDKLKKLEELEAAKREIGSHASPYEGGPQSGNDPEAVRRNALRDEIIEKYKSRTFRWPYEYPEENLERDLFYAGKSEEFRKWHEYESGMWKHHKGFIDGDENRQYWAGKKADAYAALGGMAGVVPSGRPSFSPSTSRPFGISSQRYFPPVVVAPNKIVGKSLPDLSKASSVPDRGGLTVAGRSLTKHGAGARPGNSLFPKSTGNQAQINAQAQAIVNDILSNPATTYVKGFRGRFGDTIEALAPDGRGIVCDINGKFLFFKE